MNKNKLDMSKISQMYLEGYTYRQIAKVFGVYYQTIARNLKKIGIKPRKSSRRRSFNIKIGQKIGNLEIIEEKTIKNKNNKNKIYYLCLCNCGNFVNVARTDIRKQKGCSSCKNKKISEANFKGFQEISGDLFTTFRKQAECRELEFSITIEYLWDLFLKQNKKCNLTGIEINFAVDRDKKNRNTRTASLDRIDSTKGYIKDNLQWIHKDVNYLKMDKTEEELFYWCKLIYLHNQDKISQQT